MFGIPFKVDENAKAKGSYEFYTGIEANHQFKSDNLKLNVGGKLDHSNFTSSAYDRLKYTFITGPEYQIENHQLKLDLTLSKEEMNWKDISNSKELKLSHFFNYSPQLRLSSTFSFDENDYYNNANYNNALVKLEFARKYPENKEIDVMCLYLLADCYYQLNDFARSAELYGNLSVNNTTNFEFYHELKQKAHLILLPLYLS